MERFIEFATHHYLLVSTLAVLAVAYFLNELARSGKNISPQALAALVNQHNARLIDIRDAATFRAGHITGSENIPTTKIDDALVQLKSDLTRPIVVICEHGQSAGAVSQKLKAAGLLAVYKLEGGISAWKGLSLPLLKN